MIDNDSIAQINTYLTDSAYSVYRAIDELGHAEMSFMGASMKAQEFGGLNVCPIALVANTGAYIFRLRKLCEQLEEITTKLIKDIRRQTDL